MSSYCEIIDCGGQRTEAWHQARAGIFTGSDAHILAGKGITRENLILKKACEIINGYTPEDRYINADMQRGIDLEPKARLYYELETGNRVTQVDFIKRDEWAGCSPDGLVDEDGLIEIKCPKDTVFLRQLVNDEIPSEYMCQMQHNMVVCNRYWCDYVLYNENFRPIIRRVNRDGEIIGKIHHNLETAVNEVKEILKKYKNNNR